MTRNVAAVRRRSVAILTAVACLGIVGCSGDAQEPHDSGLPSEDETSTLTNSTEPTPTASTSAAPDQPAEANGDGAEAAKAFMRFYLSLLNYASHTGDTAPVKRHSLPRCESCNNYIDAYEELYAKGGLIKKGNLSVARFRKVVPTAPEDMYVGFWLMHGAGEQRLQRGASLHHLGPVGPDNVQAYLVRTKDSWRVSRMELLS